MNGYSEIGNKIFKSKCENKNFVENKISIHKEIFKQLFFNLKNIDIDNINNQSWLEKLIHKKNKRKSKKEVLEYATPNVGHEFAILNEDERFIYWRIINLFIKDYIDDTLHFDDIKNDLESNELYLYSFGLNLSLWFNNTLCKGLSEYTQWGKLENKYTRTFRNWNISPTTDTELIKLLKKHFYKIYKTIAVICRFCLYKVEKDKEGWLFLIKSNEGILIDMIKSKEIKLNLTDKLIDFKKHEHDPQKASKHLFDILKEPYSFIDGDKKRAEADKYFNSSMLKEWRDKTQVIRHIAGDISSRKDKNMWFEKYDKMSIEERQKFQNWVLIVALMIYVWHFSIKNK